MHFTVTGSGPRVILVHGTMTTSEQAWIKQAELAERWTLVRVDRRGYEPQPSADHSDFEVDAADIAELVEDGDHLVGHSYGGLGAIFAAAKRSDAVRSLTVIETPTSSLVRGHPSVEARITTHEERVRTIKDPREFQIAFLEMMGAPSDGVPDPLPPLVEQQARLLMNERFPWDADLPLEHLRQAAIPTLVVTGGWEEGLEAAADALAAALAPNARRDIVRGRGHAVQRTGQPFNDVLESFLHHAEEAH